MFTLIGQDWKAINPSDDSLKFVLGDIVDNDNTKRRVSDYFKENSNKTPFNMGVYYSATIEEKELIPVLKASNYIGVMPLLKRTGEAEEGAAINIASRFNISPTHMLASIMEGDDVYEDPEYLKTYSYSFQEWKELAAKGEYEDHVLFGVLTGVGQIEVGKTEGAGDSSDKSDISISDTYGVFEIIDFVNKAKKVCKSNLKRQSQKVEENLTCKVKGRILIQKQIKYNETKGQKQKVYCSYNKMSPDIKENQIIKYALHLCKKHSIGSVLAEDINLCMRDLSGIPLKKCTSSDFVGLKNNGAYKDYKEALIAAKRIISRYYVTYSSDSKDEDTGELGVSSHKIQPFFINMDLLFEHYCRALFRSAINRFNNEKDNKVVFELEKAKEANRRLHDNEGLKNIMMDNYIPDIVIKYKNKGESGDYRIAAVIDAKDSNVENQSSEKRRERTHQVLFYMKALDCDIGGLISPCDINKSKKSDQNAVIGNMWIDGTNSEKAKLCYIPVFYDDKKAKDYTKEEKENHIKMVMAFLKELENHLVTGGTVK